jgi:penicillin-binding protein 2
MFWFPAIIVPGFLILAFRLYVLQIARSAEIRDEAQQSRQTSFTKLAPRGAIYDRKENLLAGVKVQFVVTMRPSAAKKYPEVVKRLAEILQMPQEEVLRRIQKEAWRDYPAPIRVGAPIEIATQIAETPGLTGVEIQEKSMRYYGDTNHFSHVMGYVWTPTKDDLERLEEDGVSEPAEYVGKTGIERAYEEDLMGVPGKVMKERRGKNELVSQEVAVPGKQLYLSLDRSLQEVAQKSLSSRGYRGAVVAIDPKTGEILAMVSNPTFDTSVFDGGISQQDYDKLTDAANQKPLLNRAIAAKRAPGSTYKIVTAMAAYQAGKLSDSATAYCDGMYHFKNGKGLKCLGVHGAVGFQKAMAYSCNAFFCTIGVRAGKAAMEKAALDMGLGRKTGIELSGELMGDIPTDKWLEIQKLKFYYGNLAQMSVGQGYVTTTPLQMANMVAMVANNGIQYRPHLVSAMKDPITGEIEKVEPEINHEIKADSWFWEMLKNGLGGVMQYGTASRLAHIDGVDWCGKTGSAEVGVKGANPTDAWFVGFAPRQNPTIAICVFAEKAGHGGDAAAPIAAEVVSHWLFKSSKAASNAVIAPAGSKPSTVTRSR